MGAEPPPVERSERPLPGSAELPSYGLHGSKAAIQSGAKFLIIGLARGLLEDQLKQFQDLPRITS